MRRKCGDFAPNPARLANLAAIKRLRFPLAKRRRSKPTWQRQSESTSARPTRHGRARGRRADRHPERRGRAHDAVRRRVHEGRPAARRRAREAAVGHEPREHDLLDQALHGPQVRRGHRGDDDRPVRGRQGPERRRAREGGRQGARAAGDQRDDPPEAQGRRRGLPRRAGHRRGRHRPRLLQQRAARGDEGRRQDRRAERPAHHQRADRGRARLRPRQGGRRPDDPRLRPRRRHVRRVGARARRRASSR